MMTLLLVVGKDSIKVAFILTIPELVGIDVVLINKVDGKTNKVLVNLSVDAFSVVDVK